jgi:hypothetical protein
MLALLLAGAWWALAQRELPRKESKFTFARIQCKYPMSFRWRGAIGDGNGHSLPKIPSERNSLNSIEILATTGIPKSAETCPTGANRESVIGCQGTPRHINPQRETVR